MDQAGFGETSYKLALSGEISFRLQVLNCCDAEWNTSVLASEDPYFEVRSQVCRAAATLETTLRKRSLAPSWCDAFMTNCYGGSGEVHGEVE
jgi:hypothetical protein